MKRNVKTETLKIAILAALVAGAVPVPTFAQATDFAGVVEGLGTTQVSRIPYVVNFLGYCIGTVMMLSGALSIKKHTENPAAEPLNKGLGRLLIGGAITSIPAVLGVMQQTSQITGQAPTTMRVFDPGFTY